MDLELPATALELVNLIKGIYKLPPGRSKKTVSALKAQLYIDFLFMPCAYGAIFILCMLVSAKMELHAGRMVFITLAYLQAVPWVCDIIENIYLLHKIRPDVTVSTDAAHNSYLRMEYVKWGLALIAAICAIAALCYFWLAGKYDSRSLYYLAVIVAEIILFVILSKLFLKNKKEELQ